MAALYNSRAASPPLMHLTGLSFLMCVHAGICICQSTPNVSRMELLHLHCSLAYSMLSIKLAAS